jgi:CheY-like chemotaxis protein
LIQKDHFFIKRILLSVFHIKKSGCIDIPQILIVDDDSDLLLLYKLFLEELGLTQVDYALNGKDAVEKFKNYKKKPFLIIMDNRMPLMNGIDAMHIILKEEKSANVIFASADNSVREEALEKGALEFLEKPFGMQKLQKIIHKLEKIPQ